MYRAKNCAIDHEVPCLISDERHIVRFPRSKLEPCDKIARDCKSMRGTGVVVYDEDRDGLAVDDIHDRPWKVVCGTVIEALVGFRDSKVDRWRNNARVE